MNIVKTQKKCFIENIHPSSTHIQYELSIYQTRDWHILLCMCVRPLGMMGNLTQQQDGGSKRNPKRHKRQLHPNV